jgi:hypothetical protein
VPDSQSVIYRQSKAMKGYSGRPAWEGSAVNNAPGVIGLTLFPQAGIYKGRMRPLFLVQLRVPRASLKITLHAPTHLRQRGTGEWNPAFDSLVVLNINHLARMGAKS